MNLEDLELTKQIAGEMVKTKKSYQKASDRRLNADFRISRAKVTTLDANMFKLHDQLEGYKEHLKKAVEKL